MRMRASRLSGEPGSVPYQISASVGAVDFALIDRGIVAMIAAYRAGCPIRERQISEPQHPSDGAVLSCSCRVGNGAAIR